MKSKNIRKKGADSRLQIGQYAIANVDPGVELRSSPYKDGITKTVLPKGIKIKVVAGPVCNPPVLPGTGSNYSWFVQTDIGFDGWVSEGNIFYGYSLEPEQ